MFHAVVLAPIPFPNPDRVVRMSQIAPQGVCAANPAFDVTPHRYVTAIITEAGVSREPYTETLRNPSSE